MVNKKQYWKNTSLVDIVEYVKGIGWVKERWRFIPGCDDYYKSSTFGRIKSIGREVNFINRWGNECVRITLDKILKPDKTNRGYLRVFISRGAKKRKHAIHRLVAQTFKINKNSYPQVNHEDGNKVNNTPSNLKWCSPEYNQQHAYKTGLNVPKSGMSHHSSRKIRVIFKNGQIKKYGSVVDAAIDLDISRSTAFNVLKSKKGIKIGVGKGIKLMYV